ncbi:MAG TPA: hypothetical protein VFO16_07315, partial [Pseudonocardiaceae bacterium]|nr:hypothetical protein [Pseudonocardiaceae bacterium]
MSADTREGGHLVVPGEVFRRGYPASTRLAVCGEPVTSAPDGGQTDPGYCGDCVSAAIQHT